MSLFDNILSRTEGSDTDIFSSANKHKRIIPGDTKSTARAANEGENRAFETKQSNANEQKKGRESKLTVPGAKNQLDIAESKGRSPRCGSKLKRKTEAVAKADSSAELQDSVINTRPRKQQKVKTTGTDTDMIWSSIDSAQGGAPLSSLSHFTSELPIEEKLDKIFFMQGPNSPAEVADNLRRSIFVGNLPADISRKRLSKVFSRCGEIESIRVRSIPIKPETKMPRRAAVLSKQVNTERGSAHAYIVFKQVEAAKACLTINMQEIENRHIRVDMASKKQEPGDSISEKTVYDHARSIFVGNLPFDVDDEELIQIFNVELEGNSIVSAVRVVRDQETNIGKGFAFVLFSDKNSARMALAKDGEILRKRAMRVTKVSAKGAGVSNARKKHVSHLSKIKSTGAEGRLERKYGSIPGKIKATSVESWQGARTKGSAKLVKSAASAAPNGERKSGQAPGATSKGAEARKKRPAVAARKAKLLSQKHKI